jgi:60 kDa SS-A/Ro ribonucleoprotein
MTKRPKFYSLDLAGHGTMQFPEQDVYCMAGFSDKVFDIMKLLESDKNALLNEIKKIDF